MRRCLPSDGRSVERLKKRTWNAPASQPGATAFGPRVGCRPPRPTDLRIVTASASYRRRSFASSCPLLLAPPMSGICSRGRFRESPPEAPSTHEDTRRADEPQSGSQDLFDLMGNEPRGFHPHRSR